MKKLISACMAVTFAFTLAAPAAHAQTYYYNSYAPQSKEAQIAYLQGIVAQLIAQIQARGYGIQYNYQTGYNYGYQYQNRNNQYGLGLRLLDDADVEVETGYAKYSGGEVTLHGKVDLKGASYAYAWFEYGKDDENMDEDTSKVKKTRDDDFSAEIDIDDLEEDEFYYYRAVVKDDNGGYDHGVIRSFYVSNGGRSSRNDDEPEANTDDADNIDENEARMQGEVDMNDFNNGRVFFVYGEDESQVEDVEDEDRYRDIDEDGDDLQKVVADSDLDGKRTYWYRVWGLNDNTDYYYRICVEYEDDSHDEQLVCGDVEHFETDRD